MLPSDHQAHFYTHFARGTSAVSIDSLSLSKPVFAVPVPEQRSISQASPSACASTVRPSSHSKHSCKNSSIPFGITSIAPFTTMRLPSSDLLSSCLREPMPLSAVTLVTPHYSYATNRSCFAYLEHTSVHHDIFVHSSSRDHNQALVKLESTV